MIYLIHLALAMAMMQQPEMPCHYAVITAITLKGTDDGDHQPVQICELAKPVQKGSTMLPTRLMELYAAVVKRPLTQAERDELWDYIVELEKAKDEYVKLRREP